MATVDDIKYCQQSTDDHRLLIVLNVRAAWATGRDVVRRAASSAPDELCFLWCRVGFGHGGPWKLEAVEPPLSPL